MRPLTLSYPIDHNTGEPARILAWAIWRLAREAREQLCLRPNLLRLEIAGLASRSRSARINDVEFDVEWEMEGSVADEHGVAVLGTTEVASRLSRRATVRLNADLIGDRTDLALSTALHELGHVVFDVPGWLDDGIFRTTKPSEPLHFSRNEASTTKAGAPDWPEWRANEFMGGFLVPRPLLTKALSKCARQLRLPMVEASTSNAPPQVIVDRYSGRFDDLSQILGEGFGLSASFLATRLIKYKMVATGY